MRIWSNLAYSKSSQLPQETGVGCLEQTMTLYFGLKDKSSYEMNVQAHHMDGILSNPLFSCPF